MSRKIAILRGINVGGHRKILMADLKSLIEKLGFTEILTYIQSGNVVFNCDVEISNIELSEKIENAILEEYDFDVPVIIRTAGDLKKAISLNPFLHENEDNIDRLFLTFLKTTPHEECRQNTEMFDFKPDRFKIAGQYVFIYCAGKFHKSKLTNNFFESKLKTKATTRNWKTVLKLLELAGEDEL